MDTRLDSALQGTVAALDELILTIDSQRDTKGGIILDSDQADSLLRWLRTFIETLKIQHEIMNRLTGDEK